MQDKCEYYESCGGCCYRDMVPEAYRATKADKVRRILETALGQPEYVWDDPVFVGDGSRRRAAMAFRFKNGQLALGFNQSRSKEIADCRHCPMLTSKINAALPGLRVFLQGFCRILPETKSKKKKIAAKGFTGGDILILEADNGIDLVLEADGELGLQHRLAIFDYVNAETGVIRFSHRKGSGGHVEPVAEKLKPVIEIAGCEVYPAPGTFLQASKTGEEALVATVREYLHGIEGHIADLFCGIGTFTYPLAGAGNKVTAVDSSSELLAGFKMSVNRQMLHNVEIIERNLFKYPLDVKELEKFAAVVFDPPRAGAKAQVLQLAAMPPGCRPQKIAAVSCNPHSFVNDAAILLAAGYKLRRVRLIDQFVYSNHSELVALFTN